MGKMIIEIKTKYLKFINDRKAKHLDKLVNLKIEIDRTQELSESIENLRREL